MSASLVGSEMCIRDRLLAWATPWVPRDGGWLWLCWLHWPLGRLFGLASGCLLYTSDAADDM
eukprot:9675051-Alexandrium_andersonii.AAC.1